MESFTRAFQENLDKDIFTREIACLKQQFPAVFCPPERDDLLAGWVDVLPIGFFPQEGGLGYYLNREMLEDFYKHSNFNSSLEGRLELLKDFWSDKNTSFKIREAYPSQLKETLPSDDWLTEPGVGFPLYRMSGSQLDFDKLIRLGLNGLKEEISLKTNSPFYDGLLKTIDLVISACGYYQNMLMQLSNEEKDNKRQQELARMSEVFANISDQKPSNLHEAAQLVMLYAMMSGSFNFGRMG